MGTTSNSPITQTDCATAEASPPRKQQTDCATASQSPTLTATEGETLQEARRTIAQLKGLLRKLEAIIAAHSTTK